MGVKRCSWGTCNADSRYPLRYPGVCFIPFAKPKTRLNKCLRWIRACGRPHSQLNVSKINRNVFICSRHFVDGRPTEENPDPVNADGSKIRKRKTAPTPEPYCITVNLADIYSGAQKPLGVDQSTMKNLLTMIQEHEDPILRDHSYCMRRPQGRGEIPGPSLQKSSDLDAAHARVSLRGDDQKLPQGVNARDGGGVSCKGEVPSEESMQTRSRQSDGCCAPGCGTLRRKQILRTKVYFHFPRDPVRCQKWLQLCGRKDLLGKTPIQLRQGGYKICSNHFEDSQFQFTSSSMKRLVPDAVPTVFKSKQPYKPCTLRSRQKEVQKELQRKELQRKARKELQRKAQKEARKEVRKELEARKYLRKEARKELERRVRKELQKEARKELQKEARKELQSKARKEVRKELERKVRKELQKEARKELQEARKELQSKARKELQSKARKELQSKARKVVRKELQRKEVRKELQSKAWKELQSKARKVVRKELQRKEVQKEARTELQSKARKEPQKEVLEAQKELQRKAQKKLQKEVRKEVQKEAVEVDVEVMMDRCRLAWRKNAGGTHGSQTGCQSVDMLSDVKVEIDYAEDPSLHWVYPQSLTDNIHEDSADDDTASSIPHLAADSCIKVEPMEKHNSDTDSADIDREPPDIKSEPLDIWREHLDTWRESRFIKTEPPESLDAMPEYQVIKMEALDFGTAQPQDVVCADSEVRTEQMGVRTMNHEMRKEVLDIKPELLYFEGLWTRPDHDSGR